MRNDLAFRKVFGSEEHTIILIDFLNAVLKLIGNDEIVSVAIQNPYQHGAYENAEEAIVDISAVDGNGRRFIVEMQVADLKNFDKRSLFYSARGLTNPVQAGAEYNQMEPLYFVGILDFNIEPGTNYISYHTITNEETGYCYLKDVKYVFIELKKFNKALHELIDIKDKWLYFIKNSKHLNTVPPILDTGAGTGLRQAFTLSNMAIWNESEADTYIRREVFKIDQINIAEKGKEEGFAEGKAEGKAEGILTLYNKGRSVEDIADWLDYTLEFVKSVVANAK